MRSIVPTWLLAAALVMAPLMCCCLFHGSAASAENRANAVCSSHCAGQDRLPDTPAPDQPSPDDDPCDCHDNAPPLFTAEAAPVVEALTPLAFAYTRPTLAGPINGERSALQRPHTGVPPPIRGSDRCILYRVFRV